MRDSERDPSAPDDLETSDGPGGADVSTPVTQQVGRVALVLVAVLFLIFAVTNAQHVDFSWVFGETEVVQRGGERVSGGVPLIVLLVVAFGAGALVATLLSWQRARHRKDR
ncbi:LapA family protein [Nitriliruptor alkaliphilus]|uniref:LapA family protein n=1 Tax=Nitriliruptor alkaliphilus TaxID=427918 RepID=UPI000697DDE0|nr:LapA family protein [Nitriliruptor alkaliphilus]